MKSLFPSMHLMRWVFAFIAFLVSGLLGSHFGAQRERDSIAHELAEHEARLLAIKQEYEHKYEVQLAQLHTQRDIADASNLSLQKTLKQLQAQSLARESTMRLYDNIEGKDRRSGLSLDTVTRVKRKNENAEELHITVVQARGRDRVKGKIGVALIGEKAGDEWREVIVSDGGKSAMNFDMRFFQTLVVPLPEHEGLVNIVEIDIKPTGKQHNSISYALDWSSILED